MPTQRLLVGNICTTQPWTAVCVRVQRVHTLMVLCLRNYLSNMHRSRVHMLFNICFCTTSYLISPDNAVMVMQQVTWVRCWWADGILSDATVVEWQGEQPPRTLRSQLAHTWTGLSCTARKDPTKPSRPRLSPGMTIRIHRRRASVCWTLIENSHKLGLRCWINTPTALLEELLNPHHWLHRVYRTYKNYLWSRIIWKFQMRVESIKLWAAKELWCIFLAKVYSPHNHWSQIFQSKAVCSHNLLTRLQLCRSKVCRVCSRPRTFTASSVTWQQLDIFIQRRAHRHPRALIPSSVTCLHPLRSKIWSAVKLASALTPSSVMWSPHDRKSLSRKKSSPFCGYCLQAWTICPHSDSHCWFTLS